MFFCLGREDARALWKQFLCCQGSGPAYALSTNTCQKHVQHHSSFQAPSQTTLQDACTRLNGLKTSNGRLAATITDGSLSSAALGSAGHCRGPDSKDPQGRRYPSFYNAQQNGCARRYWDKKTQRHRNILSPVDTCGAAVEDRSLAQSSSHAPSSFTHGSRQMAAGQSSSEGGVMKLSNGRSLSPVSGPHQANSTSSYRSNHTYDSLPPNSQPLLSVQRLDHSSQMTNCSLPGGAPSPAGSYRPLCGAHGGNDYPALPPPPPHRPHPYLLDNYVARTGNTFSPPASMVGGPHVVNHKDYVLTNGSVPRLCDYDGYSSPGGITGTPHQNIESQRNSSNSGGSEGQHSKRSSHNSTLQGNTLQGTVSQGSMSQGSTLQGNNIKENSVQCKSDLNAVDHRVLEQHTQHHLQQHPHKSQKAFDSTTDDPVTSDNFAKTSQSESSCTEGNECFLDQLEQRIPPVEEETQKPSTMRLNHNNHHRKPQHYNHHQRKRPQHSKQRTKHRRWESGGISSGHRSSGGSAAAAGNTKKPAYAFVNHSYQDKVLQRLIQQAPATNDSLRSWFPRSISAYEQVKGEIIKMNRE